jgi:diaminopimelate epimerase
VPVEHSTVRFIKYQALGNDYLVLDLPAPLDDVLRLLPRICHRQLGLGADGLLAFDPAALSVRIFNPDGSEAGSSGNGLRISACHAVLAHAAGERFELLAGGRRNPVRIQSIDGPRVECELDLGAPSFRAADLPALFEGEPESVHLDTPVGSVEAVLVSMGNPHCVVLGEPVTAARCLELGPHLERHQAFPERVNVQLAEALDRGRARCEIWERGAGRTLASGTSATAVAAALMRRGLVGDVVDVNMPGGSLRVHRIAGGNLVQSGPAQRVYFAKLNLADLWPDL